jgi:hypothetical protein
MLQRRLAPSRPDLPRVSRVCVGPDPFVTIGGGVCVNGGWVPAFSLSAAPFQQFFRHTLSYPCDQEVRVLRSAAEFRGDAAELFELSFVIDFENEMAVLVWGGVRMAEVDTVYSTSSGLLIHAAETTYEYCGGPPRPLPAMVTCPVNVVVVPIADAVAISWRQPRHRSCSS